MIEWFLVGISGNVWLLSFDRLSKWYRGLSGVRLLLSPSSPQDLSPAMDDDKLDPEDEDEDDDTSEQLDENVPEDEYE